MKKQIFFIALIGMLLMGMSCQQETVENKTAILEQNQTEQNQTVLNQNQPAPRVSWSMERDNLIKLKKLQNNRNINFFMYIFIEGVADPIGYYQVNKVSSINSQLTNPEQIVIGGEQDANTQNVPLVLASPSEDGSYGENGDAVFGFTPEEICIQTNMKYICATVPLQFSKPVIRMAIIDTEQARILLETSKQAMK